MKNGIILQIFNIDYQILKSLLNGQKLYKIYKI